MHDLAVGIINWNTRDMTLACLASLQDELNRLRLDAAVWVVDNASEDGSPESIAEAFPQVVLVRNAENVGFAKANNQFLRGCEARYYLLLNPDTIVQKGAVAALLAEIARQPHAGAVGPRLILGNGNIQRSHWRLPSMASELRYNLVHRFRPFGPLWRWVFQRRLPDLARTEQTVPVEALSMACLLLDARALKRVGLLAEDCFLFGEENDFFCRMRSTAWRGYYVPKASVTHLVGQSRSKQRSRLSETYFFRSRALYFRKHRSQSWRGYRRMCAFFLNWSLLVTWIALALGRGDREDLHFYRELAAMLEKDIPAVSGRSPAEVESQC